MGHAVLAKRPKPGIGEAAHVLRSVCPQIARAWQQRPLEQPVMCQTTSCSSGRCWHPAYCSEALSVPLGNNTPASRAAVLDPMASRQPHESSLYAKAWSRRGQPFGRRPNARARLCMAVQGACGDRRAFLLASRSVRPGRRPMQGQGFGIALLLKGGPP